LNIGLAILTDDSVIALGNSTKHGGVGFVHHCLQKGSARRKAETAYNSRIAFAGKAVIPLIG
jgi:hypothetical protein